MWMRIKGLQNYMVTVFWLVCEVVLSHKFYGSNKYSKYNISVDKVLWCRGSSRIKLHGSKRERSNSSLNTIEVENKRKTPFYFNLRFIPLKTLQLSKLGSPLERNKYLEPTMTMSKTQPIVRHLNISLISFQSNIWICTIVLVC